MGARQVRILFIHIQGLRLDVGNAAKGRGGGGPRVRAVGGSALQCNAMQTANSISSCENCMCENCESRQ